jgi:hypothetical protein
MGGSVINAFIDDLEWKIGLLFKIRLDLQLKHWLREMLDYINQKHPTLAKGLRPFRLGYM